MSNTDNLIQFNPLEDNNVWASIKTLLERIGQNSENTRDTYERAIREFFKTMRNRELEDLTESDLQFTKAQIETYQVSLRNKYKTTTVNTRMSALMKCYKKLEDHEFEVKSSWFDVDRYPEYDKEGYSTLSHHEVEEIIELVSKTRKGFEKALLVRLAYATAFRKKSLLNLRWTDIINRDDIWFIKTLGKGNKWDYKKISNELYEELMKQKELIDGDKIFKLTDKTVNRMMAYIRDNMDFGDRNIVFHSFKKASINEVNIITGGDIKAMQTHGNHSSPSTTINDYLAEKKLDDLIVVDTNRHIPLEKFDELSKDELINLIRNMDRNTQIKMLQKINVM